jgi:hypothetical protein
MLKLIALLGSGIPAIIGGLIALLGRKLGTATASVAAFVVMTAAFIACINSILQSVLSILTVPPWIAGSVGMFIPADFSAVLAAVVSSRICRVAYDLAIDKVRIINGAS